jgi:PAP2 superfamily
VPGSRRRSWWRPSPTIVRQFLLVGVAIAVYFGVRGITEGSRDLAVDNARALIRFEERVGLDWEATVRDFTLRSHELVTVANWVYIWGHWPLIIPSLIWLYVRRPSHYFWLRDAMFVSGAIGLVIFAGYPVSPHAYRVLQPPGFVNRYAAMPSLHAGWNVILGIVMFRSVRSVTARVFATVAPVAMCVAVVATANHYVIDVIAGAAIALIGLTLSARRRSRPRFALWVGLEDRLRDALRRLWGLVPRGRRARRAARPSSRRSSGAPGPDRR